MTEQKRDITEDEAALYDRQIRVWGVQAQTMMRNSKILVIGITALQSEICKNLILAGIGSLSVWDDSILSKDEDVSSHYLLNADDIGKNKAEAIVPRISELNPNVEVEAVTSDVASQTPEFWSKFAVICVSGQTLRWVQELEKRLNSLTQRPAIFMCETMNFDAFFCQNLFNHAFVVTTPGENGAADEHKNEEIVFPNISDIFSASFAETYSAFGRRCKKEASIFASVRLIYAFREKFDRWPDESDSAALIELQRETEQLASDESPSSQEVLKVVKNWRVEAAPAAAVMGGLLSQEILKTVTRKDTPLLNVTVFNGWGNSAVNVQIPKRQSSD